MNYTLQTSAVQLQYTACFGTFFYQKEVFYADDEIISFCPAVEIAALKENEQRELLKAMDYAQAIPSLSQAQRIKQLSKEKQLSLEKMEEIMCEVKKGEITRVAFTNEQLHKYFPNSYTPAMMKREILALLKLWKKESWES